MKIKLILLFNENRVRIRTGIKIEIEFEHHKKLTINSDPVRFYCGTGNGSYFNLSSIFMSLAKLKVENLSSHKVPLIKKTYVRATRL